MKPLTMKPLTVRFALIGLAGLAASLLGACVPQGGPLATLSATQAVLVSPTPSARGSLVPVPSVDFATVAPVVTPQPPQASLPAVVVEPILADASTRTGVPVGEITIVSSEEVTWRDRGLGCPSPGVAYPPGPSVDGYRLVLDAGGEILDYRGTGLTFKLCEKQP